MLISDLISDNEDCNINCNRHSSSSEDSISSVSPKSLMSKDSEDDNSSCATNNVDLSSYTSDDFSFGNSDENSSEDENSKESYAELHSQVDNVPNSVMHVEHLDNVISAINNNCRVPHVSSCQSCYF